MYRTQDQAWYRYHDLFAEMLCNQLQRQHPEQIAELVTGGRPAGT